MLSVNNLSPVMSYDKHSFVISGKREFLVSGSIHYFRVPSELWEDRLIKAKAAGLNCIQTYVAWNFHEAEEGVYDFTGDRDLDRFLNLCKKYGLYVICRPGPYICAEWDFGGFPAWFLQKSGLKPRRMNAPYLDVVDKWFSKLLPIIASHQITKGGSVILVQLENELSNIRMDKEEAALYMKALLKLATKYGIDVPLITCEGGIEGALECINSHRPADRFDEYRAKQPHGPLFSTEFWTNWYAVWGEPPGRELLTKEELIRETWRILAEGGAGYNYYMWHGGTNFGYSSMYLQTTSYDYGAPLSETGAITDKYRECRKVALFAQTFSEILTAAEPDRVTGIGVDNSQVRVHRLTSDRGVIVFFDNPTVEEQSLRATIPGETLHELDIRLVPGEIHPLVMGYRIGEIATAEYINSKVLGMYSYNGCYEMVIYGQPLNPASISLIFDRHRTGGQPKVFAEKIDGVSYDIEKLSGNTGRIRLTIPYPELNVPAVVRIDFGIGVLNCLVMNEYMAGRTWFLDGKQERLVSGAYFVRQLSGFSNTEPQENRYQIQGTNESDVWMWNGDSFRSVSLERITIAELPDLNNWSSFLGAPEAEPEYDDSEWTLTLEPTEMTLLGNYSGYGWYRAEFYSEDAKEKTLFISAYADRLLIFLNGCHVASTDYLPENRVRHPAFMTKISPKKGRNVLAVLVDNLGRIKGDWQIGYKSMDNDAKGIFGDVILDWSQYIRNWRFVGGLDVERSGGMLDPQGMKGAPPAHGSKVPTVYSTSFYMDLDGMLKYDQPVKLVLEGMSKGVVWLNGRNLGRFWEIGPYNSLYVPVSWLQTYNRLTIMDEEGRDPGHVRLVYDSQGTVRYAIDIDEKSMGNNRQR